MTTTLWEQPVVNGFEGLGAFFGQIMPVLLPLVLLLFIGATVVYIGRRVVTAVS